MDVLKDVCKTITKKEKFTYEFVDNDYADDILENTYNKGRLAILYYGATVNYISFSEKEINGRNSSVQSVPTAFNLYYSKSIKNKKLYYYFLNTTGNIETSYHTLIYRLMKTIGFEFLNDEKCLGHKVIPFSSVDDLIIFRTSNSQRNKSNNSSYVTKSAGEKIEIYGKTYGANKYETSLICYAVSMLASTNQNITLYEVLEKDLKELPEASLNVIRKMGNINVVATDIVLEKKNFEENNSLRSPHYIFNLLERLGNKKCALCDCEIPELIQGAHIWSVSSIKNMATISFDEKLKYATDGENGLWLCENHHKLFDENYLTFSESGDVKIDKKRAGQNIRFINSITTASKLNIELLSDKFLFYLSKRNNAA